MGILITIIIFSVLIVVHEFGHFIAARRAGVKVEQFAIGFGKPLLKINGKETQFLICLIPLGGYVKMAGDTRSECKGRDFEFLSKPVGVKMKIVFAGPLFNYLLALVLFVIIAAIGFPYPAAVVGDVLDGYPAKAAGLMSKDKVLEVNNIAVENWPEMAKLIYESEKEVLLKVKRDGEVISLNIPLREKEITDDFGKRKKVSIMGITASSEINVVKYSFPQSLLKGAEALFNLTFLIIKGFIFIIIGVIPFKEAMAGPVGIYYITSEAAKIGIVAVLHLMAALSVSLAIINLFPMPILDGGHLLIFTIEKIRRKMLSEKTEDILTRFGFGVLVFLIVFVLYNDIVRFGPKIWKGRKAENRTQITEDGKQNYE